MLNPNLLDLVNITLDFPALLSSDKLAALQSLIAESNRIVICAHYAPDGDAVGACLGWQSFLYKLGKRPSVVLPNPFPDFLKWLPGCQFITLYSEQQAAAQRLLREADLIFCLDFGQPHRINEMMPAVFSTTAKKVVIDHHEGVEHDAFDLVISEPNQSSTCEMIFRLVYQMNGYELLSTAGATSIYTGLMTDTGNFAYASNRPEVFVTVALLVQKGIERDKIYRQVFYSWSEQRLRLWNYVLEKNLRFYEDHRASVFTLNREEMKAHRYLRGDAEGLVNEPLKVKGMRLSISLREDTEKDLIRVSLRSTNGFHCREMAEQYFNGGGHNDAAGGQLPCSLAEAVVVAEKAIAAYADQLRLDTP